MASRFKCLVPHCGRELRTEQGLKSHSTRLHKDALSQAGSDSAETPSSQTGVKTFGPGIRSFDSQETNIGEREEVTRAPSDPTPSVAPDGSLDRLLSRLRSSVRVLKRIPRGARFAAAEALAACIDECVSQNSMPSWSRLLLFAPSCFCVPTRRSTRKVSLATLVKNNIVLFHQRSSAGPPGDSRSGQKKRNILSSEELTAKRAEVKIADGDIRGAVRIICSGDSFAETDSATKQRLHDLHPPEADLENVEVPVPQAPLQVSASEVRGAILSFPSGSAGGLDSLSPQHLKDLISQSAGTAGESLVISLTKMCNLMLSGKVPTSICPTLYGASLCALKKKSGGIRPIAVGNVFRRLVAKLGCFHVRSRVGPLLSPVQLGFGIPGGAEAAAHAARRYVAHQHGSTRVLLKVDFRNAFNMLRRDLMLQTACEQIPELYAFLHQCYRSPSNLVFGEDIIQSRRGVQQGDPLGPALFCLSVLPVCKALSSEFNVWYLDDATIAGTPEEVLSDLLLLKEKSMECGLEINPQKCELFVCGQSSACSNDFVNRFEAVIPGIQLPDMDDCVLLGAPLTSEAIKHCLKSKTEDLLLMASRLRYVSAHSSVYLLKNSLAIPKLTYLLRCSATWKCPSALEDFDTSLKSTFEAVSNIQLEDSAWLQASLPVSSGGLGIRHTVKLALPAFLASTCSVENLVRNILPEQMNSHEDILFTEAAALWISSSSTDMPAQDQRHIQRRWEDPIVIIDAKKLVDSASSLKETARYLGVSSPEAGAWLNAIPSPQLGTLLDNDSFRIAVALRLGSPICRPHVCPCGAVVDESGTHGLSCKSSAGRFSRHGAANDVIKRALVSGGVPSILEPRGLSRDDGKRPDGMTLVPWVRGKSMIWDFTCSDTLAQSHLPATSASCGAAARAAEIRKKSKYGNLINRFLFCPFAVETLGAFGPEALELTRELGRRIRQATGEKRSTAFLLQRIGIAVQRGNAAAVLGTIPAGDSLADCISLL